MTKTILLLLVFGLLLFGCTGAPQDAAPGEDTAPAEQPESPQGEQPGTEEPEAEPEPEPSWQTGEGYEAEAGKVLMLGRSVAYGWMEYMGLEWQCDDEDCNTGTPKGRYDDYYFTYHELDYPPEIALSAASGVDERGRDAEVVFFKFCFVDFAPDDTLLNAHANEVLAEEVYQYVVVDRGKKLIIGNALPQVSAHTEPYLVANHEEFNAWLDEFAATHDDVQVLDLYGMLSDSEGNLRSEYALGPEDSHLNNAGYDAITPRFLELIENA